MVEARLHAHEEEIVIVQKKDFIVNRVFADLLAGSVRILPFFPIFHSSFFSPFELLVKFFFFFLRSLFFSFSLFLFFLFFFSLSFLNLFEISFFLLSSQSHSPPHIFLCRHLFIFITNSPFHLFDHFYDHPISSHHHHLLFFSPVRRSMRQDC